MTTTQLMGFDLDGRKEVATPTFFRGKDARFYPGDASLDHPDFIENHIARGLMPHSPLIESGSSIVAFGSCFAANISNYLEQRGFNVATKRDRTAYISRMGDGIVNTYAIRQQLEWAWENKSPDAPIWHGPDAAEYSPDDEVKVATRQMLDAADVFILTYGLSEIWYDEPTGDVFWRAVPYQTFDPARHKFRVSSFAETLENIRAIHGLIRAHRPNAVIVQTLSPIAMTATFRNVPAIVANAASKAILRAALDEFHRMVNDDRGFYFPSYEIALDCFDLPLMEDRKHIHDFVLDFNMKVFERYFCRTGITDDDLRVAFKLARDTQNIVRSAGHFSVPRSQLKNKARKIAKALP